MNSCDLCPQGKSSSAPQGGLGALRSLPGPCLSVGCVFPSTDCRAVVTNGNPAPTPTPAAATATYATSPGPPQRVCVLWEAMKWSRAQFYSKANNTLSCTGISKSSRQQLQEVVTEDQSAHIQPGSVLKPRKPRKREERAPNSRPAHPFLSLVSPRVTHCQGESLSPSCLSLCDPRTVDRTWWLGKRTPTMELGSLGKCQLLLLGVTSVWASVSTSVKWT